MPAFGATVTELASPKLAVMSYEGKLFADWNPIDGTDSYQIAYKLTSDNKWTKRKIDETSFSIEAEVGENYDVKVRTITENSKSEWSSKKTVEIRDSYIGSDNKHVMLGWHGRFTSKFWRKTAELYRSSFKPLKVKSEKSSRKISLKVGQYDRCEIKRVAFAGVGESAKDKTLDVPIYSQKYNTRTGTFSFDGSWWYLDDNASDISYTLKLKKDGAYTYKYFRVKYSRPEKDPSPYLLETGDNNGLFGNSVFHYYVKANLKGKTRKIVFNGKTYKGKYYQTHYYSLGGNSNYDRYNFSESGHFSINEKTDKVCGFRRLIKKSDGKETLKSMKDKAIKFASKYIDVDKYTLETHRAGNSLNYWFYRYVGNTKTPASFSVVYTKSGKLESFSDAANEELDQMLSNYSEEEMNKIISKLKSKKVKNLILSKQKELYPEYKDEKIEEKTLVVLRNGKPGMLYTASSRKYYPYKDNITCIFFKEEDYVVSLND